MSNPKTVELVLEGSVPSKKNNRRLWESNGRQMSAPSKKYTAWQNDVMQQVRTQTRERFYKPVSIEVIIYFATLGKADLDNRLTSILDMLVECFVLRDDNWLDVPIMQVQAEHRPRKGGAFVRITELE